LDGRIDVVLAASVALLGALVALPFLALRTAISWEICSAAGIVSAVLILALFVLPLRARAQVKTTIGLARHRDLSLVALAAALIHTGGLLWVQPLTLEYLKPTAPLYMLVGLAALLILGCLVATGFELVRRQLWRSQRGFQAVHVGSAILLVAVVAGHVLPSGRYLDAPWKLAIWSGSTILGMLALLRARRDRSPIPSAPKADRARNAWRQLLRDSAFGSRALLVGTTALCAVVLLTALPSRPAITAMKDAALRRQAMLLLAFPHEKHRSVACLACHHNYVDRTGQEACIACHRSARTDLHRAAEQRFHEFCFGCHAEALRRLGKHGPLRECGVCHRREAERRPAEGDSQLPAAATVPAG
jgi:predicted CXXCH cytochrome family protein